MVPRPSLPPRRYGAVDDPAQLHGLSPSDPTVYPALTHRDSTGFRQDVGERKGKRWLTLAMIGGLAIGAMTAVAHAGSRLPKIAETSDAGLAELDEVVKPAVTHSTRGSSPLLIPLAFTALNFYHVRDGKPGQDYPWLRDVKLIEPHRDTTLAVTDTQDGFEYRWEVRGGSDMALQTTGSGSECVVILTQLEDNLVTLEEVDTNGVVTRRLEERVMVKYVRREVRTLTDDERQELLDAMYQLWAVRVQGGNGKELYGDDYADIYAINRLHYKAASPFVCDHFHDGLGFLTNHALISNTFEFSLQRVNPKLTLPYWDFSIESSSSAGAVGDSTKLPDFKSPIFDASWFGTYDPTDNMVKDGRWAYTEIPKMMKNNPGDIEPDVYSKLRAPWNVNDRAYLTRGMGMMCGVSVDEEYPWPTCDTHFDLVTEYNSFYSWAWFAAYDPHGSVHVWIGGVVDCEDTYTKIASLVGESAAEGLALYAFIHRKNMYRDGVFKCDGTAGVDQAPDEVLSSGMCGCLDFDLSQGDDYKTIYDGVVMLDSFIGDADEDTKRQVVAALCTMPMNDGDHLQASSSLDPSFWSTHPTMERLWMYSVLTGQIEDYTWPDSDITFIDSNGIEVSESLSLSGDTCFGHAGSDVFPFGLLETDTDGFEVKTAILANGGTGNTLTNREALQAFDPRANGLTYIYDTFKWEHCALDGVDFDKAWGMHQGASASNQRPTFEKGAPRAPRYKSIIDQMEKNTSNKTNQK